MVEISAFIEMRPVTLKFFLIEAIVRFADSSEGSFMANSGSFVYSTRGVPAKVQLRTALPVEGFITMKLGMVHPSRIRI